MNIGFVSGARDAIFAIPPAERVAELVAREKGIPKSLLFNSSRCRAEAALARQLAMYLTHVILRQNFTAIGLAFGRDRTTVSHACALIEDLREDPDFEADVSRLEALLENHEDRTRG
ncbi:helix-turn-helix domain-containing protein [Devosia sp. YIM 151766]|uniref:helix-turn-helix domain-containing protein n=1 Tax=Devosia sp. YIM 151766 TaxID=3017325 RepID=UPI00255C991C|nr:helix-turn-helix domain-containing protein [Devosia sp. YIM 151766]WIY53643.1 helix-turn-helix domain-containing protein [Devosia sp. YIM 151766]